MTRLLLIIALVVLVYLLIRSYRKSTSSLPDESAVENMVRCTYCGMHLPKGESIQFEGHFFCGTEHRDAFRR